MSQGYNGWTNYETWAVKLWMDNEEGTQVRMNELAEQAYREAAADETFTRAEQATSDLAEALKNEYEAEAEEIQESAELPGTLWADLLNAALSEVNWFEIAKALIEELDTDEIDAETADE